MKTLKAVALGIPIIDDKWVAASMVEMKPVEHMLYLARDSVTEKKWKVPQSWSSGSAPLEILAGKCVYITPTVRKQYGNEWKNFVPLLRMLGAKDCASYPAHNVPRDDEEWVVIGQDREDPDAYELHDEMFEVYTKDLISWSILRGSLSLKTEEFRIKSVHKPGSFQPKSSKKKANSKA